MTQDRPAHPAASAPPPLWPSLVVALLAAAHALSFLGSGPIDDDFIVYRYARNWLAGEGLAFNPGEPFEGFTAPLWLLLISAGLWLRLDPVVVSLALSVAGAAFAAFGVDRALRWRALSNDPERLGSAGRWPFPAWLVALSPALAWHAVAGLGTTLLAGLLALWWSSYERAALLGRPSRGAALWLALACLLRQEMALFVPVYLAFELRRSRSAWLCAPLAVLLGWTLFRRAYFGRWLPITYSVKKLDTAADLAFGFEYLRLATLTTGVGLFLLATLALGRLRGKADGPVRAARAGLWLHAAYVVWVGGDFVPLARFFVPTLPLFVALGWLGIERRVPSTAARRALAAGLLLALQWPQLERPQRFGEHAFFEERWARLGRHFAATTPAKTRVAIAPIGAFGWYAGVEVVDILGLTHDGLVGVEPDLNVVMKGHQRFDADWVLDQEPDFMILANGVRQPDGQLVINPWERDLYLSPRFQADYVHVRAPIPKDAPLDVFQRRGVDPLPGSVPVRR